MKTRLQRQLTADAKLEPSGSDRANRTNTSSSVQMQPEESAVPPVDMQMQRATDKGHSLANFTVQPALVVGEPGDKYEKEADSVAARAVQADSSEPSVPATNNDVQRQPNLPETASPDMAGDMGDAAMPIDVAAPTQLGTDPSQMAAGAANPAAGGDAAASPDGDSETRDAVADILPPDTKEQLEAAGVDESEANSPNGDAGGTSLEARIQTAMGGGGKSLSDDEQHALQTRLGIANPEDIVVHDSAESYNLCTLLGARAFTTQNHIFFGEGEYGDQELLYHEATHCVQQGGVTTTDEDQQVDAPLADPEASVLTPAETGSNIAAIAQPDLLQRDTKETDKDEEETEINGQTTEEEEQQKREEEEREKGEETKQEGESQTEEVKNQDMPGDEETPDLQNPDQEDTGGQTDTPETQETDGGGEVETPDTVDETEPPDTEEIDIDDITDEYEPYTLGPTLEDQIPGYGSELRDYNSFQGAKAADAADDSFWMDFLGEYDATEALTEQFDAEDASLDKGALIGEAIGLGLAEGALAGLTAFGAGQAMEGLAEDFPKAGAGLGAVMTVASLAADPEGWWEGNVLKFGDHAKDLAGITKLGDASSFWEGAAILMEAIIGLLSGVRQIYDLISNILNLVGAILFIIALISYGVGSALAAGVVTAPAAPPFFTVASMLFSWSKTIKAWTKPLSTISLYLTVAILPFRLLAIMFRAVDIATYEGDPQTLLEKQEKLHGHVKNFVSDGMKVGVAVKKDQLNPKNLKAPTTTTVNDITPTQAAGEEDADFQIRMQDFNYQKSQLEAQESFKVFSTPGMATSGKSLINIGMAALVKGMKGEAEAKEPDSEQEAVAAAQEEYDRGEILPQIQERIIEGADELPEPPSEEIVAIAATSEALPDIASERQSLILQKQENQVIQQEAIESQIAFSTLSNTAQLNRDQIGAFQGQLGDKQEKQDVAIEQLGEVQGVAGEAQGQADTLEGMIGGQKNNIETGMKQGASQGAGDGSGPNPQIGTDGAADSSSGAQDGGRAAQAGQEQMQHNQSATKAASSEAAAEDKKLETFQAEMDENTEVSTEALEKSQGLDEEIDESLEQSDETMDEAISEREEAVNTVQAWVDEHKVTKEGIFEDLIAIITGELGSEEAEELSNDRHDDLSNESHTDANLIGVQLQDFDLSGVDFSKSNLTGGDLSGADLEGANLQGADLTEVDLTDADLKDADLSEAILDETDFTDADTEGAKFDNAKQQDKAIGLSEEKP